jgi:hypothetical protein
MKKVASLIAAALLLAITMIPSAHADVTSPPPPTKGGG